MTFPMPNHISDYLRRMSQQHRAERQESVRWTPIQVLAQTEEGRFGLTTREWR